LKESDGDGESGYPHESREKNVTDIESEGKVVDQEILRNLSGETPSTANSSGIITLDLLAEVYATISDSESEHGDVQEDDNNVQEDDNDRETVVHMNRSKDNITPESQKKDVPDDNSSLFSFVSSKIIASCWVEDKPFDEESLRAMSEIMSEQGACLQGSFSKGSDPVVEEYILPPVTLPESMTGMSSNEKPYDVVKKSSMKTTSTAPMVHTLPSQHEKEEEEEDESRSKKKSFRRLISKDLRWIACVLIVLLLAVGITAGLLVSLKKRENEAPQNEAVTAPTNSTVNFPSEELDAATAEPTQVNEPPLGNATDIDTIPEDIFPLGLCEGDCDRNADCAEGLVCFQRGPNDPVPFCKDGELVDTGADFCTYPVDDGDTPVSGLPVSGEQSDECFEVSVVQDCSESVTVVIFENCDPEPGDWVAVYPDGSTFDDGDFSSEFAGNDYLNWAFTCGDIECNDSPVTNSIAFPTGDIDTTLSVYLLRNSNSGDPPYEVIAKSVSFEPTQLCQ
jgi:cytochrome c556